MRLPTGFVLAFRILFANQLQSKEYREYLYLILIYRNIYNLYYVIINYSTLTTIVTLIYSSLAALIRSGGKRTLLGSNSPVINSEIAARDAASRTAYETANYNALMSFFATLSSGKFPIYIYIYMYIIQELNNCQQFSV